MAKLTQREGVYVATMNCLADAGISFDDNQAGGVEKVLSKEVRANVLSCVTAAFQAGEIDMSAEAQTKYADEKKLRSYVSGLMSNWFRKDTRLNGNVKHVIANPGSRAGAGDDQLKALKALAQAKADDSEAVAAINAAIEARKSELKVTKQVELTAEQIALIPEELRTKLGM